MKRSSVTHSRPARCSRFLAALALVGLLPPALHAQTACDDVSGAWAVDLVLPGSGTTQVTLTLDQAECVVTGMVEGNRQTLFEGGSVEGSTATFTVMATNQANGESLAIEWKATVDGDDVSGTLASPMMGSIEFTGTRVER